MFPRVLSTLETDTQGMDEAQFVRRYPDSWLVWENRPGERSNMPNFTQLLGSSDRGVREFEPAAYRLLGKIKSLTIGRNGEGILIKDSTVSETHLTLNQTATGWSVTDAGSRNGTIIDGTKIPPATPVELTSGAQLQIGAVKMTYLSASGLFKRLTAV